MLWLINEYALRIYRPLAGEKLLLSAMPEVAAGWDRGHDANKREFIATMEAVDRELGAAGGPFFLGSELSMVDVVFAPFLERIAASILYYKGFTVRGEGCAVTLLVHSHSVTGCLSYLLGKDVVEPEIESRLDMVCRRWKNLDRWFEAMEARPAYIGTRSDYFTHVYDLPPQLGGQSNIPLPECPHWSAECFN